MVVIINGEIVPDDDPRAIARKSATGGGGTAGSTSNQRAGPRLMSMGDLGSTGQQRRGSQAAGGNAGGAPVADDVDGLLTPLSKLLGIPGRRVQIPPIPQIKFTGYAFPLVHVVVSLFAMLAFGNWRYFIVALLGLAILNPS